MPGRQQLLRVARVGIGEDTGRLDYQGVDEPTRPRRQQPSLRVCVRRLRPLRDLVRLVRVVDAHLEGSRRQGSDASGLPFDLSLNELTQHVFIPGLPGAGKTTTLTRLMDGALAHGYGVVVIDCKGGGLRADAKRVAGAHGLGVYIVSPSAPDSLGYNPCTGPGYSVANKIVGALSFGGEAGIYRDVALGIIPPIVDAMRALGRPVTLDRLHEALATGNIGGLATQLRQETGDMAGYLCGVLEGLEDEGGVFAAGRDGLRHRLTAFRNGAFGALLRKEPALVWGDALARPSVAYVELPALGADQDVDLLSRVVLQDLKEVAKARIDATNDGKEGVPLLLIIDEFAALREAGQIGDLLLQGREAKIRVVVASQFLPENAALRNAVVGAGLLLVHRVGPEDAALLAAQAGTRGTTDEPNITPQTLATLPLGQIAVRSVARSTSGWCGLVTVHKEIEER